MAEDLKKTVEELQTEQLDEVSGGTPFPDKEIPRIVTELV